MAHAKEFAQIPMSKCMRDLCKEEDYIFLNSLREQDKCPEESELQQSEWREKQDRVRRRQEQEQREQERRRALEEQRKDKEEQWKHHVAELAVQREAIHAKLHRLREFRDFQKKVLLQDLGLDPDSSNETIKHLLMRL